MEFKMVLRAILNGFAKGSGRRNKQGFAGESAQALKMGDSARDRQQWSEAALCYSNYLKDNPRNFPVWVQLGHAAKESGDFGQAEKAYRYAMQLVENDADLHLSFGHLYKVMGDIALARMSYTRSFEINGNEFARDELLMLDAVQSTKSSKEAEFNTWISRVDTIGNYFDIEYYLNQLSDHSISPGNAARHYLEFGSFMFLNPSPIFSTRFYLEKNDDLDITAGNALIHYLSVGQYEGRQSCNIQDTVKNVTLTFEETYTLNGFDETYYRSMNNITTNNIVAIKHYVNIGWKKGYNPSASFDVEFYLATYSDVRNYRFNPLMHYLQIGRSEGRLAKWPTQVPLDYRNRLAESNDFTEALISPLFDSNYYRSRYADIAVNKLNPLRHFLVAGAAEFRDPSAGFDTNFYCKQFPGIQMSQMNPLVHYALVGKQLGATTLPASKAISSRVDVGVSNIREPDLRVLASSYKGMRQSTKIDDKRLHIHWIIPEFSAGGGGHMTIFRMVKWLELFGHRCTLWVINADTNKTQKDREEILLKNYQIVLADVFTLSSETNFGRCDCLIATGWDTAYAVAQIDIECSKFYFIQDYEPSFYPMGSKYLAAKETYSLGLASICASSWLKDKMINEHSAWARGFALCADENYNRTTSAVRNSTGPLRIAFYAREHTTRRAVELGMIALEILKSRSVEFIVDFFGTTSIYEKTPFEAHNWGIVDPRSLAELYHKADIGVCFSSTNYSLVPQEMMACGLPVVELSGESTKAIFPNGVVTLAEANPAMIADALQKLMDHPEIRSQQAQAALQWVGTFSWEKSAREVEKALLERMLEEARLSIRTINPSHLIVKPIDVMASVVIPTYNAGPVIQQVIDAVIGQKTPWSFEIVIIDSGSIDGTIEILEGYKDQINLIKIRKEEFQHGRTRNLGIEQSTGRYIAFLTQDALPADDQWLYPLVTALERFPRAAGAFGRHLAWEHASAFTKRDMKTHFDNLLTRPIFLSKYENIDAFNSDDHNFKSSLHFYSDNNSCLRRDVWNRIKYPEVDYGEDQLWASLVSSAGYGLVYVSAAAVYHSHDYDEVDTFKRSRTEADFFRKWFGYELAPKDIQSAVGIANALDERWGLVNGLPQLEIDRQKRLNIHRVTGLAAGSFEGIDFESPF